MDSNHLRGAGRLDLRLAKRLGFFLATLSLTGAALAGPAQITGVTAVHGGKRLADIEPRIAINETNTPGSANALYTISEPGSYYLVENLQGQMNLNGIVIAASGVTLDLMGFELFGGPGSLNGIAVQALRFDITIRDGTLRGWGGSGIDLTVGALQRGALIEDVSSSTNGLDGFRVGRLTILRNCIARGNAGAGFSTQEYAQLENCSAHSNGGAGILTGVGASVTSCHAIQNGALGIHAGPYSTVRASVARSNQNGIQLDNGGAITQSTGSNNSGWGIIVTGGLIAECTASDNGGNGIVAGWATTVTHCTAMGNTISGIRALAGAHIRFNTCRGNGTPGMGNTSGIEVAGTRVRVEGNLCTSNATGFYVGPLSANNVFLGNTSGGNSVHNWNVSANNTCFVVQMATSDAVIGNSGGATLGSSNPYVNFTF